jgi:hypothetical protein
VCDRFLHVSLGVGGVGGGGGGGAGGAGGNQTPVISGQTLRNSTFMLLVDGIVNILGL